MSSVKRIFVQAAKEWDEFKRDRLSLSLAFLLPLITLLLFGYGVRMQSHDIGVVIKDNNNTELSRALTARIYATNMLRPATCRQGSSIEDCLNRGEVKAAIKIPANFQEDVLSGKGAEIETLVDGTDVINARLIENTIDGARTFVLRGAGLEQAPVKIETNLRTWFNPGLKEALFIVPGVCGIVLWMFPSLLSCVATAREKEQGTVVQVFVSRITAFEMIAGKSMVYLLIGLCQAALVVLLACLLFGIRFAGDPTAFLITLPIFVFSSVLFGLAVGSCADSQTTAVQGVSSLGFFTCLLLSGFVYPIDNIPFPLSLVSYLVPSRYFMIVSRDAFERGLGWQFVWVDPIVLALFCICFYYISWSAWRRMQFKV